jgi:AcrR family transcriptional regulator
MPSATRRPSRAAPMAPDERRRAIIEAVVPLLLENGDDVTTKQIAEAAGIAEGTIFRVFPDKAALLMATAEETMDPAVNRAQLEAALAGADTLREKVLITVDRLFERSERVTIVLMALRRLWMTQPDRHREHTGPPRFMTEANLALHELLTSVFEGHRDELAVEPELAATLLRTLVLGSRHPGSDPSQRLTRDQVADALLDGIRCHPTRGD